MLLRKDFFIIINKNQYSNQVNSAIHCFDFPCSPPKAVSMEKEDYYADILIYVTGCVLFILAVVIIVLCRMRMTTQKTLPTPPVQKLSKFPLKRQVTESRYKICITFIPFFPLFLSV